MDTPSTRDSFRPADGIGRKTPDHNLPRVQRQTLELAYFDGYTHAQIAKRMAVPLGTVKGRLRGGLRNMAAALNSNASGLARGRDLDNSKLTW